MANKHKIIKKIYFYIYIRQMVYFASNATAFIQKKIINKLNINIKIRKKQNKNYFA